MEIERLRNFRVPGAKCLTFDKIVMEIFPRGKHIMEIDNDFLFMGKI